MAFLKVKRKCEEDPKEIFVLASKKHKLQDISDNVPIFQLASPAVKEEDVNDIIVETIKNRSVKSPKCDLNKLRTRMRQDNAERIKENRYQMYAATRELDDDTLEQRTVPVISVTGDGTTEDGNPIEWVYDLYYSSVDVNVAEISSSESHFLADLPTTYFYDDVRSESEDEVPEDDDDSNDENNWRNDYPDEESSDDGSGSYDSLSGRMRRTRIRSDNSLSSSDFDEYEFYEDNDYCDEVKGSSDSDDS